MTDAAKIKAIKGDVARALSLDADCAIGEMTEHEWFSASRPLFRCLAEHCNAIAADLEKALAELDELKAARGQRLDVALEKAQMFVDCVEERDALRTELARIKAATPEKVREIAAEHARVDATYEQGLSGSEANECHRNRATLLEVVRAQEAEIEQLRKDADKAKQALSDIANDAPVQCLVARMHEGTLECSHDRLCLACQASHRVQGLERQLTTCRAATDKTRVEADRMLGEKMALEKDIDFLRKNRDALAHGEREALKMHGQTREQLAAAERDKAALADVIREAAPFAWLEHGNRVELADEWSKRAEAALKKHGALAPREGEDVTILSIAPYTKRLDWGDGEVDCVRVTVGVPDSAAKPQKAGE